MNKPTLMRLFRKKVEQVFLRFSLHVSAALAVYGLLLSVNEFWKDRDFQHLVFLVIALIYASVIGSVAYGEFRLLRLSQRSRDTEGESRTGL